MGQLAPNPGKELKIIYHPDTFADGVRILMLTTRSKEGGRTNNPDRQLTNKKYVTRSTEEYYEKLDQLIEEMNPQQRIYSTVDNRNIDKAVRIFKERQLDADYYDQENRHGFYVDIYNRWISALQAPQARVSNLFLYDIDDEGDNSEVEAVEHFTAMEHHGFNPYMYRTKNGYHIITDPHNPIFEAKPQKNAMLLVAYYQDKKIESREFTELPKYNGRT